MFWHLGDLQSKLWPHTVKFKSSNWMENAISTRWLTPHKRYLLIHVVASMQDGVSTRLRWLPCFMHSNSFLWTVFQLKNTVISLLDRGVQIFSTYFYTALNIYPKISELIAKHCWLVLFRYHEYSIVNVYLPSFRLLLRFTFFLQLINLIVEFHLHGW